MKKIKLTSLILAGAMLMTGFTACTSNPSNSDYTVGVIQFGSHPSLDNCYAGIVEGLEESSIAGKYTIDHQTETLIQLLATLSQRTWHLRNMI